MSTAYAHSSWPPLTGNARLLGTAALAITSFMVILDTTIANVSVPAIAGDLGASPAQGTWVITTFSVAMAAIMPVTGWLARRTGEVRLCVSAIIVFIVASCLCGLSQSLPMLVACRVLQGLAAGVLSPLAQSLLLQSYPRERAGSALAAWSATTMLAPLAGPIAGGWITDNLSWPWIFFINVPFGALSAMVIWSLYCRRESKVERVPIDVVGLLLLVVWVGAFQILLDEGDRLNWFDSREVWVLAIATVVGFVYFVGWELTDRHPVVDLSLFRDRNFATVVPIFMLASGLYLGNAVVLPLWLQTQQGYTAQWAGLALACSGAVGLLSSLFIGRLSRRVDARILATAALATFVLISLFRSSFTSDVDFATVATSMLLPGAATLLLFIPMTILMYARLPAHRLASASGLANFARVLGGAISVSLTVSLWNHRAQLHHQRLAEGISNSSSAYTQMLDGFQSLGLQADQARAGVERIVDGQAYLLSTVEYYRLSALLYLVLMILIWLVRPEKRAEPLPEAVELEI